MADTLTIILGLSFFVVVAYVLGKILSTLLKFALGAAVLIALWWYLPAKTLRTFAPCQDQGVLMASPVGWLCK